MALIILENRGSLKLAPSVAEVAVLLAIKLEYLLKSHYTINNMKYEMRTLLWFVQQLTHYLFHRILEQIHYRVIKEQQQGDIFEINLFNLRIQPYTFLHFFYKGFEVTIVFGGTVRLE